MKGKFLKDAACALTRKCGKAALICKKYSPEILIVTGTVGVIAGVVMACKETLKAEDILDEHQEEMNKIDEASEKYPEEYTEKDRSKDIFKVYTKTVVKFIRLYLPSALTIIGSLACIFAAFGIIKKRNIGLMAAYEALSEEYKNYRKRVAEKYGQEEEKQIASGEKNVNISSEEASNMALDTNTGNIVELDDNYSPYSRFFDETCREWKRNPECNRFFLEAQERYFNQLLKSRGHVFLNEVYEALGFPHTPAGSVVGWLADGKDGYISFGIHDGYRKCVREFINGYERSIRLDFNVDGVIYDKI